MNEQEKTTIGKWKIITIDNQEINASDLTIQGGLVFLESYARIKRIYDKRVGHFWWKKIESISEFEDKKYVFCILNVNRVKEIWLVE